MPIGEFLKGQFGGEELTQELAQAGITTLAELLLLPPKYFVRFNKYSEQSSLDVLLMDEVQAEISDVDTGGLSAPDDLGQEEGDKGHLEEEGSSSQNDEPNADVEKSTKIYASKVLQHQDE